MDVIADVTETAVPEEILIEVADVSLKIDETDSGKGKLVLTTSYALFSADSFFISCKLNLSNFLSLMYWILAMFRLVTWTGATESCWGYRDILMHAISKEGDVPALYTQMKGETEFDVVEIRFVPDNAAILEDLYAAFSRGACLNPDEPEDEGEAGNFYFNVDQAHAELNGEEEDGEFEEDEEENGAE